MYDSHGLPSIEDLTSREPAPERGELAARILHHMGEADAPPAQRDPAAPDTSALRAGMGL